MTRKPPVLAVLALATSLLVPVAAAASPGAGAAPRDRYDFNAMAPLKVTDWPDFEADLDAVADYGVEAVSVDVWWGDVERRDNRFRWRYYDRVFATIADHGLDIAPILSFHQCGGNVGDDYTSLLPDWLWEKYADRRVDGRRLGPHGLQHRSEQGNYSRESVQGWADRLVLGEYRDFTESFTERYGREYAREVTEVLVSLGPAGELRYPSYNQHDEGTGYPSRGGLQSYSPVAQRDFRGDMRARYDSLRRLNRAWGTDHERWRQVRSPRDAEEFFTSGDYRDSAYGQDFVAWYNGSLVAHGERVLRTVIDALGRSFPGAPVGYKVPGIHWQVEHPVHPRATEVTTGLVRTDVDLDARRTAHGYRRIIGLANRFDGSRREVTMHFTALEMDDAPGEPAYSRAKTLVGWIGQGARDAGVELKGENALAGGLYSDQGWDNIEDAFEQWGYSGLTVLRMSDVNEGLPAERYAGLIGQYAD